MPRVGNSLGVLRLAGVSGSQPEPIGRREDTVLPPAQHDSLIFCDCHQWRAIDSTPGWRRHPDQARRQVRMPVTRQRHAAGLPTYRTIGGEDEACASRTVCHGRSLADRSTRRRRGGLTGSPDDLPLPGFIDHQLPAPRIRRIRAAGECHGCNCEYVRYRESVGNSRVRQGAVGFVNVERRYRTPATLKFQRDELRRFGVRRVLNALTKVREGNGNKTEYPMRERNVT